MTPLKYLRITCTLEHCQLTELSNLKWLSNFKQAWPLYSTCTKSIVGWSELYMWLLIAHYNIKLYKALTKVTKSLFYLAYTSNHKHRHNSVTQFYGYTDCYCTAACFQLLSLCYHWFKIWWKLMNETIYAASTCCGSHNAQKGRSSKGTVNSFLSHFYLVLSHF